MHVVAHCLGFNFPPPPSHRSQLPHSQQEAVAQGRYGLVAFGFEDRP